jgi:hypothetical protein
MQKKPLKVSEGVPEKKTAKGSLFFCSKIQIIISQDNSLSFSGF